MLIPFDAIAKELIKAWKSGSMTVRIAVASSYLFFAAGTLIYLISDLGLTGETRLGRLVGVVLGSIGAIVGLGIIGLQKGKDEVRKEERVAAVEKRVQEHPKETKAAWDLARIKLEDYLDRNLSQVRSIFWLTILVMGGGFALIATGAYQAFQDPKKFNASVLTSVSGVIVSFIGGTFLILYKSTMAQAKEYVTMLERINAVGMSVQILETLNDGDRELKHETIADVAKQLLQMYSAKAVEAKRTPRSRKAAAEA